MQAVLGIGAWVTAIAALFFVWAVMSLVFKVEEPDLAVAILGTIMFAASLWPLTTTVESLPYRGTVILSLNEGGVGRFARLDDGSPLSAGELRVQYRRHDDWRGPRLDYGAQSFFFQEGDAELYQATRYAVLRVAADGGTVLTDLADETRRLIMRGVN